MIYLDNGATSFHKPAAVRRAVLSAMKHCANPGRGGHVAAMTAADTVYRCRELAGELFDCHPERVVFTSNCTHGLNLAIRSLIKPGSRVVISGFEHNAVTRPLHALGVKLRVAGRKLFDWDDTLESFDQALRQGVDAAVFTHASNVFGYILPHGFAARTAVQQRLRQCAAQQQTCSLWPQKSLVTGHGYEIRPQILQRHRKTPGRLGRIHDERNTPLPAHGRHLLHRQDIAEYIGRMGKDRRIHPLPQRLFKTFQRIVPVEEFSTRHTKLHAQCVQRPCDRIVFKTRYHHAAARFHQRANGQIQSVGTVGREYHPLPMAIE